MSEFKQFLETVLPLSNFNGELLRSIKTIVGGKWQLVESAKINPRRFVNTLYGQDIMTGGDHYVVRVYLFLMDAVSVIDTDKGDKNLLLYCAIRGDRKGSIEKLPSFQHSMLLGLDDVGNSPHPQSNPKEALRTPREIGLFIKHAISSWYFKGDWGDDKGNKHPIKPPSPSVRKSAFSLSV